MNENIEEYFEAKRVDRVHRGAFWALLSLILGAVAGMLIR